MPTEHPILFTAPMVRAILDGTKTQTRRVIKPQPPTDTVNVFTWFAGEKKPGLSYAPEGCWYDAEGGRRFHKACPYGAPGDRLWVREAFVAGYALNEFTELPDWQNEEAYRAWYKATDGLPYWTDCDGKRNPVPWKPSIHMPRWASRILLEATDIRVERVQEITLEDVRAEGVPETWGDWGEGHQPKMEPHEWDNMRFDEQWQWLWDSINAKRGYSWGTNPWVWVVSFKKETAP